MPAVFVNGNPESAAIWEPLLAELDRTDVLRLSPPGFGAEVPDGFDCTVPAYREWLTAELEALGEPVDLVGHDVGGSTVVSVAMARPGLLRTWASDSLGLFDIERMAARGISGPVAEKLAAAQGPDMPYPNLVYFNELEKGGHFAAWEQPELFAGEMRAAFRSLR